MGIDPLECQGRDAYEAMCDEPPMLSFSRLVGDGMYAICQELGLTAEEYARICTAAQKIVDDALGLTEKLDELTAAMQELRDCWERGE